MLTYTLKVEHIQKETEDTITLCFKQPALKKVKYLSGQYLTLMFRINGRRFIRPYSFSSAPGFETTLNVTIKRVTGGVVSNHIIDKVKIGDIIEAIQPMGDFTLDKIQNKTENNHIVLWGSGSGITPLISIAKYALSDTKFNHITLVYGNKTLETTIFADLIYDLERQYDKFSVIHFHSKAEISEDNSYLIQGRIDPERVIDIMKNEGDIQNTVHYICGPVGLKRSVKQTLGKIGVLPENIFSEDFEIVRDSDAFKDISTQNVVLNLNNEEFQIEVTKGKSILEAALDAMIDLPYSCQTGSCLLCVAKLTSGKIKTIGLDHLPENLQPDERILCCSFPESDNIEVIVKNNI